MKKEPKINEGMVELVEELPPKAEITELHDEVQVEYKYKYTTGPISLPQNTHSLDWGLLNNDSSPQKVRVTVFKCNLSSLKSIESPGPLELVLDHGETTHNANKASGGFFYEIQVECNSKLVFPYAAAWPGTIGDPIAGTVVKSAEFIREIG